MLVISSLFNWNKTISVFLYSNYLSDYKNQKQTLKASLPILFPRQRTQTESDCSHYTCCVWACFYLHLSRANPGNWKRLWGALLLVLRVSHTATCVTIANIAVTNSSKKGEPPATRHPFAQELPLSYGICPQSLLRLSCDVHLSGQGLMCAF